MRERTEYDYAIVRVVPSVERGEFINAGIILYARSREFLASRVALDEVLLSELAPSRDAESIREHLDSVERICVGGPDAGPIGELSQSQRFHWLVSPRSTMIQVSPVHSGICDEPDHELDRLFERLVERPRSGDETSDRS